MLTHQRQAELHSWRAHRDTNKESLDILKYEIDAMLVSRSACAVQLKAQHPIEQGDRVDKSTRLRKLLRSGTQEGAKLAC